MKKRINLKSLTQMGLFIALIFIGGFVIKIPTAGGFVHVGDCMVLLSGIFLGSKKGALTSGIGMALVDIMSGYTIWAPFTFIIKALMAFTCAIIFDRFSTKSTKSYIISFVPACFMMILGYFMSGIIIAAFLSEPNISLISAIFFASKDIIGNIFQAIIGIIIAIPLCKLLLKAKRLVLN